MDEVRRNILKKELLAQYICRDDEADIIVVAHNQPLLVDKCLKSLQEHTDKYKLWIWDNASDEKTMSCILSHNPYHYHRCPHNIGFIRPNNLLYKMGQSPYVILLNSDTEVRAGWKKALLGYLQANPLCACVGYLGGMLDNDGYGESSGYGGEMDYVMGWCMAMPRQILSNIGLFDEEAFSFAYCEDSDLCLRMQHFGYEVYALHLGLVYHVGGATIKTMADPSPIERAFHVNHAKLIGRWRQLMPERFVRENGSETNV